MPASFVPTLTLLGAIGLVLLFSGGLVAVGLQRLASANDPTRERLHGYAEELQANAPAQQRRGRPALARLRVRLNAVLSSLGSESLALQLARANWPISVPEYVLIRLGATFGAFLLGWLLGRSPLSGIGLALIAYFIPVVVMRRSIHRRQTRFAAQLVDVLVLLSGSVRAGHSLLQAMEVVARDMKAPAGEEFARVVREVSLGRRLPDALANLAARMQNADLDLAVTSITIQYQVGGNIAVILSAVTETIRERIRLFGEVRVLTTQQRYSSYLISVLPFFIAGIFLVVNPEHIMRLWDPRIRCIPIGALFGIVIGHVVIQRIIKIDV
jgi:tight adherence protein B